MSNIYIRQGLSNIEFACSVLLFLVLLAGLILVYMCITYVELCSSTIPFGTAVRLCPLNVAFSRHVFHLTDPPILLFT